MALSIEYDFDNAANYTYDSDKIEFTGSVARLKLVDDPGTIIEDYSSDTGFTYDSDFVEFSGGLIQQKDTRSSNSTFYASYGSDINGDWGSGTLTGTAVNGASISGGKLDLAHNDVRYVNYNADGNADSQQTGCIRFRIIPNYSGAPSANKAFCTIGKQAGSLWNLIQIHQDSIGKIRIALYGDAGAAIFDGVLDTWLPTAGIIYEIEFNWDITTGASRLFVDGVQLGSTITNTGTRSSDINLFRVGSTYDAVDKSDFYIEDIIIFSTVQHTANYTPDWTDIYDTIYRETKADLPPHSYSGAGSIQAFTNFVTTDSNARYIINDQYWNGSAWVTSDGSWAQSSTAANVLANIASLPAADTVNISVIFNNSNTIGNADNLVMNYTGKIYPTDNPTILPNSTVKTDLLYSLTEDDTVITDDAIKVAIEIDGVNYYWDGSAWQASAGYSNTNDFDEITDAIIDKAYIRPLLYLHSDDGLSTPEITSLQMDYDYYGDQTVNVDTCVVYGYICDENGAALSGVDVFAEFDGDKASDVYSPQTLLSTITDDNGYFEFHCLRETGGETQYTFRIYDTDIDIQRSVYVPDQGSANLANLEDVPSTSKRKSKLR